MVNYQGSNPLILKPKYSFLMFEIPKNETIQQSQKMTK